MGVQVLPGATVSGANTVAIPEHAPGDLIVVFAYGTTARAPSLPAAGGAVPSFVTIDARAGSFNGLVTAYAVATSDDHTSGTWANATAMIAVVLRGAKNHNPVGGHAVGATGFGTGVPAPAVTMARTDGTSALLHFYGVGDSTNNIFTAGMGPAPAGYTDRARGAYKSNNRAVVLITKDVTTSDGAVTIGGGYPWYLCTSVEILAADSGAFFGLF